MCQISTHFESHRSFHTYTPYIPPCRHGQLVNLLLCTYENRSTMEKPKRPIHVWNAECMDTMPMSAPQLPKQSRATIHLQVESNRLISNKHKNICIMYNVQGHVLNPSPIVMESTHAHCVVIAPSLGIPLRPETEKNSCLYKVMSPYNHLLRNFPSQSGLYFISHLIFDITYSAPSATLLL